MSAVATAIVGAAIIGGVVSSDASRKASNTQADAAGKASDSTLQATRESNALQWQQYQQSLYNQTPYMQGGQEAYSALLGAMGLGAPSAAGQPRQQAPDGRMTIQPVNTNTAAGRASAQGLNPTQGPSAPGTPDYVVQPDGNTSQRMQIQAAPGPAVMGGQPTGISGGSAITAPADAGNTGIQIEGIGDVSPKNYGATQDQLDASSGAFSGQLAHTFNADDLKSGLAPNYDFQLQQGLQALKASRAATGSLQTGQGLKDINDYAQNQASGAYQQAFQNWNTQNNNLYTRLQGIIAPGTGAATAASSAGQAAGAGIAATTMGGTAASNNFLTGGAAASAAGTVGQANAWSGAIGSAANGYAGYTLYNKALGGSTPAAAPAAAPSGYYDAGTPASAPVG